MKKDSLNVVERVTHETPKWFKIVRNVGLGLTALSGAILAAPIALPTAVVSVAGYLALGGAIASAVAQTAVKIDEADQADSETKKVN